MLPARRSRPSPKSGNAGRDVRGGSPIEAFRLNLGQSLLQRAESAVQYLVLTSNAKAHVGVEHIAIGKRAPRHAGHAARDQHFVQLHRAVKSFRDASPKVKGRTRIIDFKSHPAKRFRSEASLARESLTQIRIVVR